MLSAAYVSRRALTLRDSCLALIIAGSLATLPGLPLLTACRLVWPHEPDPVITLRAGAGKEYRRSVQEVMESVSRMGIGDMSLLFFQVAQMMTAIDIADCIKTNGHHDSSEPVLEFLRHYRNGCAHGGRWHFRKGEPKNYAAFDGFETDRSWHGKLVTKTVLPYHHVRLLEAVSDHFGPPASPDTNSLEARILSLDSTHWPMLSLGRAARFAYA